MKAPFISTLEKEIVTQMNSEQELLSELKLGSSIAFEMLYKQHFKMIASLITRMGGKREDVEDVFQESLFVLVKKIREPDFKLTAKIGTFLHAVARNTWLKKSQSAPKEINVTMDDIEKFTLVNIDDQEHYKEKELMIGIILDKINTLDEDCQNVIRMTFIKKMSHAEVADILGYSLSFIKVKKFRCLGYLRKMVADSPFFQI